MMRTAANPEQRTFVVVGGGCAGGFLVGNSSLNPIYNASFLYGTGLTLHGAAFFVTLLDSRAVARKPTQL
eukprot:scaffold132_cov170-Amphora_coffeaeformis.AAC.38